MEVFSMELALGAVSLPSLNEMQQIANQLKNTRISNGDDQWKDNLNLPAADSRPQTEDVTNTRGEARIDRLTLGTPNSLSMKATTSRTTFLNVIC